MILIHFFYKKVENNNNFYIKNRISHTKGIDLACP